MKKKDEEKRECPKCGSEARQWRIGSNKSGTQRFLCGCCRRAYTPEPRPHKYDEETKKAALRMLVSGTSGRKIGLMLGMCKNNAYEWAKEAAKKGTDGCG